MLTGERVRKLEDMTGINGIPIKSPEGEGATWFNERSEEKVSFGFQILI